MTFHDSLLEYLGYFTPLELLEIVFLLVGAVVLSYLINSVILPRLRKRAARNQSAFQRMVFKSLKGEVTIWVFALAGIFILDIIENTPLVDNTLFVNIVIGIGIFVGISILWFIKDLSDEVIRFYARKGRIPKASLFINLIKFTILIIIALSVLNYFGISVTSFIAALGIGGLAVALALQDTLGNVISGLSIISSRQIQEGDYIELESGEAGYVFDIAWRNTTIQTLDQDLVIIPNLKLSNSTIINTSKPTKDVRLRVNVGIGYESDLDLAEEITLRVAKEVIANHPKGVPEFEPILLFNDFADSSINYSIVMKVTDFDGRRQVKHVFIKALTKAYREHGINIPFPMRTVHMNQS